MLSETEKQKLIAFTLMARRYTIPLLEEDELTSAILGTATLFTVNSKYYLITAAHVIADIVNAKRMDRIGLPLGLNAASVANLGNHFISYNREFEKFDVAIIRLDQTELVSRLKESWDFLSIKNVAAVDHTHTKAFIAGYPRAASRTSKDFKMSSQFMCFATTFLDHVPEEADDVQPGVDVFLNHEESGYALDGNLTELPKLQGVSGASVWSVLPDLEAGVWNSEDHVRVVAVEVACRAGLYVRAKSWLLVANLFEAIDRTAAREITIAMERTSLPLFKDPATAPESAPVRGAARDDSSIRQARREYYRRLGELMEMLEDQRERGNHERMDQIKGQIEVLVREFQSAVGVRLRDRRVGSEAERSRLRVMKDRAAVLKSLGGAKSIDDAQFTVYRPQTVAPMKWATLLAFAHRAKLPPDAPEDEPDPLTKSNGKPIRFSVRALPSTSGIRRSAGTSTNDDGHYVTGL